MVFTYLVYLHFLGFESVHFKNIFNIPWIFFFQEAKNVTTFTKEKLHLAASVPAECHIQGGSANSPQVCELRLSIHSEMCVVQNAPAHHSCPSGTLT